MTEARPWGQGYRLTGIALVVVACCAAIALVAGSRPACLLLAGVLAAAAGVRAVAREPRPAIAIRSRAFDVGLLSGLAVVIGALAATTVGV